MRRRDTIKQLERAIVAQRSHANALTEENRVLRRRWASLHILTRVLSEIAAHRAALAPPGSATDTDDRALQSLQLLLSLSDEVAAAAADPSSSSSRTALGPARPAAPQAGDCPADAVASLAASLPHLAPERSLLHLEGLTRDDVAGFVAMDAASAKVAWAALVKEAMELKRREAGGAAGVAADLAAVGLRMLQWKTVLCLNNVEAYMPSSCTRLDDPKATELTCGEADAGYAHWEHALLRETRLTRLQAELLVDIHAICMEQIAAFQLERAQLTKDLADATASPPGQQTAARGGPWENGGEAVTSGAPILTGMERSAHVDALVEAIAANTRCEGSIMLVCWQAMPAIFTLEQWARHNLTLNPQVFKESL